MLMTQEPALDTRSLFERDGIVFPIPVLTDDEVADAQVRFAALVERQGKGFMRNPKQHLLSPWLNDMVRNPRILDAIEPILGPDILCWGSSFFAKRPHDRKFLSWHQDTTYWHLTDKRIVTAWVAFTPSTVQSGCMRVVPGTHKGEQLVHRENIHEDNMLGKGQELPVQVDEAEAVEVVLRPGEMSLHHGLIFHGSGPNQSDHQRVGFAIRYFAASQRQTTGRTSAFLVRGVDDYGHFDPEPAPQGDHDEAAVAFHDEAMEKVYAVLYSGQG